MIKNEKLLWLISLLPIGQIYVLVFCIIRLVKNKAKFWWFLLSLVFAESIFVLLMLLLNPLGINEMFNITTAVIPPEIALKFFLICEIAFIIIVFALLPLYFALNKKALTTHKDGQMGQMGTK